MSEVKSIKFLKPVKAAKFEYKSRGSMGGSLVYKELFEAMETMESGQAIPLPVPEDTEVETFKQRLSNAYKGKNGPKAPDGTYFHMTVLADGSQVHIRCSPLEQAPENVKKALAKQAAA